MAAGQEEVKLFGGWYSPFVYRVEVALKIKGIPYEVVEEDVTNKSKLLLKVNPVYKKIPVLFHNGKSICESLLILEYIDETWKHNPILPQDPYEKAMARFWAHFFNDKFTRAIMVILTGTIEERKQKEVEKAMAALTVLEGQLKAKGKTFFGGDRIGYVDIVLGWIPRWVGAVEEIASVKIHDPEKFPLIDKWMLNFVQIPVIKETLPQHDKLVKFLGKIRSTKIAFASAVAVSSKL
ncbi:probable glutathione S-transferase [Ricinus communis]|uniref:glutathione transferase n=1 Tax=Ricinus communis TaxID=3988 RepID=B9S698_RICCO|nr:probable glutathione S-transferase [Ricinus communis]EEF40788.1 glutathione s-transferase, putative [Ricinus communis]|eukprot:XP_002521517.1 probable glutathione S-transferase [Ricinus communis]